MIASLSRAFKPSRLSAAIERDVEKVRARLDYPEDGELVGYRDALEALDRLARLAHAARRAAT